MSVPIVAAGLKEAARSPLTETTPEPAATAIVDSVAAAAPLGTAWEDGRPLWVFGYGSIIYRVDFPIEDQVFGYIHGRRRAFLQRSHDHRGTETNPGRVCTLIPHGEWDTMFPNEPSNPDAVCWGIAYKVKSGEEKRVKQHLDWREKDGYTEDFVDVFTEPGKPAVVSNVLVYVGVSANPSFAGPSSMEETAMVIARAEGPSGTNREYLFKLCEALRFHSNQALEPYLATLEIMVRRLLEESAQ
ncbi:Cation transport regulator-like protein 2 [Coemansia guatemalensis]|uniref:glutathione-specific gamma-glutamylcyclotransferase n=1 Tax=Coemansia guatemalensis TaxID=2761395 RepID=A0A9W8LR21_9FUNG|nr:Cation transport regulator-like protein 2 [Coemansia guatemalensis]